MYAVYRLGSSPVVTLNEQDTGTALYFAVPNPQFSISLSNTAPEVESTLLFSVPSPEFNINVSNTAPSGASLSFGVPSPQFSIVMESTVPDIESTVSFNIPTPEFRIVIQKDNDQFYYAPGTIAILPTYGRTVKL